MLRAARDVRHAEVAREQADEEQDVYPRQRDARPRRRDVAEEYLDARKRGVERVLAHVHPRAVRRRERGRAAERAPEDGGDEDREGRDGAEQKQVQELERAWPGLERIARGVRARAQGEGEAEGLDARGPEVGEQADVGEVGEVGEVPARYGRG